MDNKEIGEDLTDDELMVQDVEDEIIGKTWRTFFFQVEDLVKNWTKRQVQNKPRLSSIGVGCIRS